MIMGKRIKNMRLEKGLSQQELGDLLGVTKVSVCGYENGTRTPSLEVFNLIAETFNTTTDYLLGREITVYDPDTSEYLANISKDDIHIIETLKENPKLYDKLTRDSRRYVSLINKRLF